jgi:hypothetical protein
MLPVGEIPKSADRVVTDRRHHKSSLLNRAQILLQFHELDFAIQSPVRRTEKDQHGPLRTHDRLEVPGSTVLVRG